MNPGAELVCRKCGVAFPANETGAPRWYCLVCAKKSRAGYFRTYTKRGGLRAGAVVKCRYCSVGRLVYNGLGPTPTTCPGCKRKQAYKRVQRFRARKGAN